MRGSRSTSARRTRCATRPSRQEVIRLENKLVNSAAKIWSHHALALRGSQDERDRLGDALLIPRRGDGSTRVHLQRELEADSEEISCHWFGNAFCVLRLEGSAAIHDGLASTPLPARTVMTCV